MFQASIISSPSHFHFEAYGDTVEAAKLALKKGMLAHARFAGIPAIRFWNDYVDDISVCEIGLGCCYRDREIIRN